MSVRKGSAQNCIRAKSAGGSVRGMCLSLGSGDQNGNKVPFSSDKAASPDSMRSSSSLSSSSRESPADVEMVDYSLSKEVNSEGFGSASLRGQGPAPFHSLNCGQGESGLEFCGKPASLYNKPDNWNDNLALVMTSLQENRCQGEGGDRSADASPDPAINQGEGEPAAPSHRGSCDDDGQYSAASISSGEMVFRKNDFSLIDSESAELLNASSLGETSALSSAPSEIGTSSIVLPVVCEGLLEKKHQAGVAGKDIDSPHRRILFSPRPSGEDAYLTITESPLSLPSEMVVEEHQTTDPSLTDSSPAELHKTYIECELLQCSSGVCTPIEGRTFIVLGSEDSDTSCHVQASTPVESSAMNKTCLLSFSDSPFQGDRGDSPAVRGPKGPMCGSVPLSPVVSRTSAANKQVKRFPQKDLKNIKSKIRSRLATPLKESNSTCVVPSPSKPTPANRKTPAGLPVQRKTEASEWNKRPGSSSNQSKGVTPEPRLRRFSECDSASKPKPQRQASVSLHREKPTKGGASINNVTFNAIPTPPDQGHKKAVQGEETLGGTVGPPEANMGANGTTMELCPQNQEVRPVSIAAAAAAAASDVGKSKLGLRPSPTRARGSSSRTLTANLRLPVPVSKASAPSKDGRTPGSMSTSRTKQTPAAGNLKMTLAVRPPVSAGVDPGTKPTSGPELATPRPAGVSRLSVKSQDHNKPSSTQASVPAVCKPDSKPARPTGSRAPAPSPVGKSSIPNARGARGTVLPAQRKTPTAGGKNAALPNQTPSKPAASPLRRPSSGGFQRTATAPQVDKNRQRASPRTQPPGPPDLPSAETKAPGAEREQPCCKSILQLRKFLASGNRRFEAGSVVIQQIVTEHEENVKQKQELSQELVTLRGELVTSATSCENLEREKDELRAEFEGVMRKVQEQHRSDLADLEERLKGFYSAEWEKLHQTYQEEVDKCKSQTEQQLDDLKSKHEALMKELEVGHAENLGSLKQHYETALEELRKTHKEEIETLDETLKEAKAKLTEQIEELSTKNEALEEKMKVEEERRMLADKNQKDSHTVYLEQELESLTVVLDIKNKQLQQQTKKLMEMDKLMEKSVKLEECLKKVQQENEDLNARMDKHAALSRQLSTEQAVLQESLQKESKANKRLSMENEELLWKLHNGDLSSPRKLSPSSPSKTFQSPTNSSVFSSSPVSPR